MKNQSLGEVALDRIRKHEGQNIVKKCKNLIADIVSGAETLQNRGQLLTFFDNILINILLKIIVLVKPKKMFRELKNLLLKRVLKTEVKAIILVGSGIAMFIASLMS